MEQCIVIKIAMEDGLNAIETHQKPVHRDGQDALRYPTVTYWRREFRSGTTDAEDCPRSGRAPDLGSRVRIENA
jgi:hypothetical protein